MPSSKLSFTRITMASSFKVLRIISLKVEDLQTPSRSSRKRRLKRTLQKRRRIQLCTSKIITTRMTRSRQYYPSSTTRFVNKTQLSVV